MSRIRNIAAPNSTNEATYSNSPPYAKRPRTISLKGQIATTSHVAMAATLNHSNVLAAEWVIGGGSQITGSCFMTPEL